MSILHNLVAKLQIPIGLKLSKEEASDETCEVVRKKQYLLLVMLRRYIIIRDSGK
jgi:hypothetical protein